MGMFSEIHADAQCSAYEQILLAAIESKNDAVMAFAKKHIYPKYQWELGEAWRKENEIIKQAFN